MRRIAHLRSQDGLSVVTNDLGEYVLLDRSDAEDLAFGRLSSEHPRALDLHARGLLEQSGPKGILPDAVRRTRKSFLMEGPALHIFVVTLRCDHSCQYCQVSRAAVEATGFDMNSHFAVAALDRVFESDAPTLTIEFQGGEPAIRFDIVRDIVMEAKRRAELSQRDVRFAMSTTLHFLNDEELTFCRDNSIHLTTSLDGPDDLHARQRPRPGGASFTHTLEGLARARQVLGQDGVAALPTITRRALERPEEIVDTYVKNGFRSIFLRPLAPYGFARKTHRTLGYTTSDFMRFYRAALGYILSLNAMGIEIEETTAAIAMRHILTPFHSGYVDIRSPAGAGLGVLVYNYDGWVYPSDEARMAAETGDFRFRLGRVSDSLDQLLSSPAMAWLALGAVAELQSDCEQCAFVPYCGADPVYHAIEQGAPDARRHGTSFCDRNLAINER